MSAERTFIVVKPDGVQRGLVSDVIKRFEQRGFKLVALKFVKANRKLLEEHYAEHKGKPFFEKIVSFMSSSPIVAMVWEGTDVVNQGRKIMGATRPLEAAVGTLRGDFGIDCGRNIVHGSDSLVSAAREIALWFSPDDIVEWQRSSDTWIFE